MRKNYNNVLEDDLLALEEDLMAAESIIQRLSELPITVKTGSIKDLTSLIREARAYFDNDDCMEGHSDEWWLE